MDHLEDAMETAVEEVPTDGPTFEDLAIDDTLTDVERISKYATSHIALQRLVHVKMIADTAQELGYEGTRDRIVPILKEVSEDAEFVVRLHLAMQIPGVSKVLVQNEEEGFKLFIDVILPIIGKLAGDYDNEVRAVASASLVEISALIPQEDLGQYILTIVLPLAHDDDNEDLRISAIVLLNDLAELLGKDLCHQFIVPELSSLAEDPLFRVRKATALNFHNACRIVHQKEMEERLLPAYLMLAKDVFWGVRKACAENLMHVSKAAPEASRKESLLPLFESFINDSSKFVRIAAFQNIGPFLATLKKEDIPASMIKTFTDAASGDDSELKYWCAYNFPAMTQILGKDRWGELASAYADLSLDFDPTIKRTLAHSLHEMANIIGQEYVEGDLVSVFETYLHDSDEVKCAVISHMASFLKVLTEADREYYLNQLEEIQREVFSPLNWRFRLMISNLLEPMCHLFPTSTKAIAKIGEYTMTLFKDDVAYVRKACLSTFPTLLEKLETDQMVPFVEALIQHGQSENYLDRLDIIAVFETCLHREGLQENFQTHLKGPLFTYMDDPVRNVRSNLMEALEKAPQWFLDNVENQQVISAFKEKEEERRALRLKETAMRNARETSAAQESMPQETEEDVTQPPPAPQT